MKPVASKNTVLRQVSVASAARCISRGVAAADAGPTHATRGNDPACHLEPVWGYVGWLVSSARPPHLPLLTPQNCDLDLHDLVLLMPPSSCSAVQTSTYSGDVQQLCPSGPTRPALVAGLDLLMPFLHLLQCCSLMPWWWPAQTAWRTQAPVEAT